MQSGSVQQFVELQLVIADLFLIDFDPKDSKEIALPMQNVLVEAWIISGGQHEGESA